MMKSYIQFINENKWHEKDEILPEDYSMKYPSKTDTKFNEYTIEVIKNLFYSFPKKLRIYVNITCEDIEETIRDLKEEWTLMPRSIYELYGKVSIKEATDELYEA